MRTAIAVALIGAAAVASGCSEARGEGGPTLSRSFPVGEFTEVELAGAYDVDIRTGAAPGVSASGPESMIERLEVEVRGGKLLIRPRQESWWRKIGWNRDETVTLKVTVPQLSAATIAGAGEVRIDRVQGDRFEGQIAGSGDMRVGAVEVGSLKLGIAGSGGVTLGAGRARTAEYDIAGSGEVAAESLEAQDLKVSIAGSGDVRSRATGTADVDIMGSGDVEVTGGARCTVSKGGSGDVRCS